MKCNDVCGMWDVKNILISVILVNWQVIDFLRTYRSVLQNTMSYRTPPSHLVFSSAYPVQTTHFLTLLSHFSGSLPSPSFLPSQIWQREGIGCAGGGSWQRSEGATAERYSAYCTRRWWLPPAASLPLPFPALPDPAEGRGIGGGAVGGEVRLPSLFSPSALLSSAASRNNDYHRTTTAAAGRGEPATGGGGRRRRAIEGRGRIYHLQK